MVTATVARTMVRQIGVMCTTSKMNEKAAYGTAAPSGARILRFFFDADDAGASDAYPALEDNFILFILYAFYDPDDSARVHDPVALFHLGQQFLPPLVVAALGTQDHEI